MGEVTVHLEHEVGAGGKRVAKRGEVRRPKAFLPRAVEDLDKAELGGECVGELPRSIRRAVVDNEHACTVW